MPSCLHSKPKGERGSLEGCGRATPTAGGRRAVAAAALVAANLAWGVTPAWAGDPTETGGKSADTDAAIRRIGAVSPADESLESIRIGLLTGVDATYRDVDESIRRGVVLALEEANAGGGWAGLRFEIVPEPEAGPWEVPANALARLVLETGAWVVLSGAGPAGAATLERAAWRLGAPVVLLGPGVEIRPETDTRWALQAVPAESDLAAALAPLVAAASGGAAPLMVVPGDDRGDAAVAAFEGAWRTSGNAPPPEVLRLGADPAGIPVAAEQVVKKQAPALVLWLDPRRAGMLLRALSGERGKAPATRYAPAVFGTYLLDSDLFVRAAGPAGEGTTIVTAWNPAAGPEAEAFAERFQSRYGRAPDAVAAMAFDAGRLVCRTIERSGLKRAKIMEGLESAGTFGGVTGEITVTAQHRVRRRLWHARLENGVWQREGIEAWPGAAGRGKSVNSGRTPAATPPARPEARGGG